MVTGKLPFRAVTTATIVKAIQEEAPFPPLQSVPELAPEIRAIIETALEKDRNLRFQTASEMRAAMSRAKRASSTDAAFLSGPRVATVAERSVTKRKMIASFLSAAASIAGVAYWILLSKPAELFENLQVERITGTDGAQDAAISPDGNYVVYVLSEGERQTLSLKHIPTASSVQLAALSSATYSHLMYSPDGNFIYYLKLERVGTPAILYRCPLSEARHKSSSTMRCHGAQSLRRQSRF